jgi:hypothetical protein
MSKQNGNSERKRKPELNGNNGLAREQAYESIRLKLLTLPEQDDGLTLNQKRFLMAYSLLGNITAAAEMVGLLRQVHYDWLKTTPAYPAAFEAAKVESIERLEAEARRRAMGGSDTLLIFLLKAARPAAYRDLVRYVDGKIVHDHQGGVEHRVTLPTHEELLARRTELEEKARKLAGVRQLTYTPHHADGAGGIDES